MEKDKKEYKNKPGYCPKCGGINLKYYPVSFNGNNCYFDYTCEDCGIEGKEYYYMEFVGHNFYDKDKGEFNTGEDMKIAKILGDDIDNPKYTFRIIESITDKRIETLSKKFYEIKKESDSHKLDFDNMGTDIDNIFDNIEQELYYRKGE